jgi:hypothetical protein
LDGWPYFSEKNKKNFGKGTKNTKNSLDFPKHICYNVTDTIPVFPGAEHAPDFYAREVR